MEGSSKLVLLSLLAALILDPASGSCFGKDANWEVNVRSFDISVSIRYLLPLSNYLGQAYRHPALQERPREGDGDLGEHHQERQVRAGDLLDSSACGGGLSLIGCRCVDKFFVWVWPDGTQKTERTARRIQVDKTKTSHIVQVSCGWLTGGHVTSAWPGGALHRLQVRPGVGGGRHEEELPLDLGRVVQDLGGGEPRVAGQDEVQRGLPLGPRQARVRPQARLHQIPEKPHQECELS